MPVYGRELDVGVRKERAGRARGHRKMGRCQSERKDGVRSEGKDVLEIESKNRSFGEADGKSNGIKL